MSKTDVRGSQTLSCSGSQTLSVRGRGPFLLATTSVARASAIGLDSLEKLEYLEKLEELELLEKLEQQATFAGE